MYVSANPRARGGFLGELGAEPGLDPGTWRTQMGVPMPRAFYLGPIGVGAGVLRAGPPPGVNLTGQSWGPDGMFQPWTGLHIQTPRQIPIGFQCWEEGSPYAKTAYGQECGGGSWNWTAGWYGIAFAQPQFQKASGLRVVLADGTVAYMPTEYQPPFASVSLLNQLELRSLGYQVDRKVDIQARAQELDGLTLDPNPRAFWWHPSGYPVVVWNGGGLGAPPGFVLRPICVEGTLSTYAIPGVTQTWPKVGDYLVGPSPNGDLYNGWKSGTIPDGSRVKVCGMPDVIRSNLGILPDSAQVLDLAAGPAPGEEPTYPEEWKPTFTPEPAGPTGADEGDQELTETFTEPTEAPTGVPGALVPSGGVGPSEAPGAMGPGAAPGAPTQAGFGGVGTKETVVLFGLLALPLLFGKRKK